MVRTGHNPEATPAWWHDFAGFVRRALHAAVDQVEPQADGLETIRARIPAGSGPGRRRAARRLRHRRGMRHSQRGGGPGGTAPRP
jgi:hypothetical protein